MSDLTLRLNRALEGRYRIERELGEGGMALVFLADDLKHDRKVAVKVLKHDLAAAVGGDRFLSEIRTTANLQHPHILPLFDSGEADGFLYYVMPFIDGESLEDRLAREGPLSIVESLKVTEEVAAALAYAHEHGVIHRDIKPGNVMLSSGEAVVTDFGIARVLESADVDNLTESGMAVGTPSYMSPEQCFGDETVDERTDIYSLGCLLYHLLAGEPPFSSQTSRAAITKRLTTPAPRVTVLRETVPPAVEGAITKALARAPADRFRTASEFRDTLRRARLESIASSSGATQQIAPAPLGRWWRTGSVVTAALLLAVAAWTYFGNMPAATDAIERLAVLPLENMMGDAEQEYFVAGMHDALIVELGRIESVDVISRRSVARYEATDMSLRDIADQLGVDGLVTGSVLRAGNTVRVGARLIALDPEERQLWSESYDEDLEDVLGLHTQVAKAIASEISVTLTPQEEARLDGARPVNAAAYDAYLRGRFMLNRRDAGSLRLAIRHFEDAREIDPAYALAQAGLADAFLALAVNGVEAPNDNLVRSVANAEGALEIDPELGEAWATLGWARMNGWEWGAAEEAFASAIQYTEGYASAHQWYGQFLVYTGRLEEGLIQLRRAKELDPLGMPSTAAAGMGLFFAGQNEEASRLLREATELAPTYSPMYPYAAAALSRLGRSDEAIELLDGGFELHGRNLFLLAGLLAAHVGAGSRSEADAVLAEMMVVSGNGTAPLARSIIGTAHALLGNDDEAIEWIERAVEQREPFLAHLKVQPEFAALQDDPRFLEILRRIGLPE